MDQQSKIDIGVATVLILLSVTVFILSSGYPVPNSGLPVNAFPRILAGIIFLLLEENNPGKAIQNVLVGVGLVVVGSAILAPSLARLIAEPMGNFLHPGDTSSRKRPMYSIPETKRARGYYEEAIAGFEKIAEEYPGEVKPWISIIDISIRDLSDPDRAQSAFHRGLVTLKSEKDRQVLTTMYEAIRSRLGAR